MADQVTQSSFKPLHDTIFKTFRRLECDGTLNQDQQVTRIFRYLKSNYKSEYNKFLPLKVRFKNNDYIRSLNIDMEEINKFFSIDMKSCTERFPVEIQKLVLEYCGFLSEKDSIL